MLKQKQLTLKEVLLAFEVIRTIPVRLVSADIRHAVKLAAEYNIYAYDAYFLQCALYLSCPLLTLDKRMKQVANDLKIEVLE
ncbi:type II toxin-antitoxin system VapC family toxin [Nitrospira sp. M1]